MGVNSSDLIKKGNAALEKGDFLEALLYYEQASRHEITPASLSGLGYCLAREQHDLPRGLALCHEAVRREPNESRHYHRLGCVYLLGGQKHLAISVFRKGLKFGRHQGIIMELKNLGIRRPPLFPSLGRKHPFNKFLGILFTRVGMR